MSIDEWRFFVMVLLECSDCSDVSDGRGSGRPSGAAPTGGVACVLSERRRGEGVDRAGYNRLRVFFRSFAR